MCCYKGLFLWVPSSTIPEWPRASTWWIFTSTVSKISLQVWLIQGHPVLDSISIGFKTYFCKIFKVLPVEPYISSLLKCILIQKQYNGLLTVTWSLANLYIFLPAHGENQNDSTLQMVRFLGMAYNLGIWKFYNRKII